MNKRKLNKVFKEIKEKTKMDYAITNADAYGDCNTCVNSQIADVFGMHSTGIYTKHWLNGMNAGEAWKYLNHVYIGHDITPEQAKMLIEIFKANGYIITPDEYDPNISFLIEEAK